jgi:hypothetical protein
MSGQSSYLQHLVQGLAPSRGPVNAGKLPAARLGDLKSPVGPNCERRSKLLATSVSESHLQLCVPRLLPLNI